MRVIGGTLKGRRLSSIKVGDNMINLRPTGDRVKENLFNILLGGKFEIKIEQARILDIFAGTGALGIEAISRGGKSCTFVEKNKSCLKILNANISSCNIKDQTSIKILDATEMPMNSDEAFNLVFLDPPYRRSLGESAIRSALASNWLSDNALVVLEEGERKNYLEGFSLEDVRKYGDTILHFFQKVQD